MPKNVCLPEGECRLAKGRKCPLWVISGHSERRLYVSALPFKADADPRCRSARRKSALDLRRGGWAAKPSLLDLDDPVHGIECSLQIDLSAVMFAFQLRHQIFELVLCGIDLLLHQARPFLQFSADITHRLSPHQPFFYSLPFGSDRISIPRKCGTIA